MAGVAHGEGEISADINITPLADVMLVLLIIFMITAPLSTPSVKVTLPKTVLKQQQPPKMAPPINLAVKQDGSVYWDGAEVSQAELRARLAVAAQKSPQPPLRIRADKSVRYSVIRNVLETAKGTGMVHMLFVTNVEKQNGG